LIIINFFRDPERTVPEDPLAVVSPADGKVVAIDTVMPDEYLKQKHIRVSIFLSVFDVHVNRIPIDGKIEYLKYVPGKFLPAFNEAASFNNERMYIGIKHNRYKFLVVQIAGIIARRIVCDLREGMNVKKGDRFGMIKFGSRTDLYLPSKVRLNVKVGDKVKGAETVIGYLKNEK